MRKTTTLNKVRQLCGEISDTIVKVLGSLLKMWFMKERIPLDKIKTLFTRLSMHIIENADNNGSHWQLAPDSTLKSSQLAPDSTLKSSELVSPVNTHSSSRNYMNQREVNDLPPSPFIANSMNQFNGTIQSENANITDCHLLSFNETPFIQATEHTLPRMDHDHLIPVQSVLKEVKVSTPVQAKTVEQPSQIARDKSNKLCDESVCE